MKNNADVNFVISEADMDVLKNVEQIEDYGNASMFPVYGGELSLKSMLSMILRSIRG